MAFTLRWRNDNKIPTVVRLYRDTKAIDPTALPAVLATFTNGETEYTDTSVVFGATYYYFTTVTANGRTVNGINATYTIEQRRGVGPNSLQYGNDQLGYFGSLLYDDQFPLGQFQQKVQDQFLARGAGYNAAYRLAMDKFIRNGKILYMLPQAYVTYGFTWASLYAAGMVYGQDDAGPAGGHGALADAIQDAGCTWKGDKYRLRMLRGLSDSNEPKAFPFAAKYNGVSHDTSDLVGFNEFNDLFYASQWAFPLKRRVPGWRNVAPFTSSSASYADGYMCMEHDTQGNNSLYRGTIAATITTDQLTLINYKAHDRAVAQYIPVIELVEDY
ncbi:hypothetical protein pEaSNUABM11_00176 [Erwinia phage pEa_SNUABM_11]|nr:hypothetical protein pEaSNUABM11_00176 [Erwinia phage pEa_SNUABM_11]